MRHSLLTLLFATAGVLGAQSKNLDIYWIDVEGVHTVCVAIR